jgi:hypothetical protein
MKKLYDAVVKTGSYTKGGQEKGRYENVGSVMEGDNGPFLLLRRTFNPAGVPGQEGRDSVLVSLYAPKEEERPKRADDPPW